MTAPRAAVAASLPQVCAVCGGARRVRLLIPGRPAVYGGPTPCPHCNPRPVARPVPIYVYPTRVDVPNSGGAA